MEYTEKKIAARSFLIYAAINVFVYTFSHLAYLFTNDVAGVIFEYIGYYTHRALEFLAPPALAAIMLVLCAKEGIKKALLHTLLISCARIFYTLPYYYIIFIYNYRYDSIESLLISLIASISVILLTALGAYISFSVAVIVMKRRHGKSRAEIIDSIPELISKPSGSDFLNDESLPILIFVLLRFALSLITEIFDTVIFFVKYGYDYTTAEILTMLANYVFIFLLLIASYFIACGVKNYFAKHIFSIETPQNR